TSTAPRSTARTASSREAPQDAASVAVRITSASLPQAAGQGQSGLRWASNGVQEAVPADQILAGLDVHEGTSRLGRCPHGLRLRLAMLHHKDPSGAQQAGGGGDDATRHF